MHRREQECHSNYASSDLDTRACIYPKGFRVVRIHIVRLQAVPDGSRTLI